tara:strand:+ start:417 stop:620 length:204 start_codon:yes stop_codon:yes gene_type:complete
MQTEKFLKKIVAVMGSRMQWLRHCSVVNEQINIGTGSSITSCVLKQGEYKHVNQTPKWANFWFYYPK